MPYIPESIRARVDGPIEQLEYHVQTYGTLNYTITKLCQFMNPETYDDYNALIGVLECVKMELYRRAVVPYENAKMEENGDVY